MYLRQVVIWNGFILRPEIKKNRVGGSAFTDILDYTQHNVPRVFGGKIHKPLMNRVAGKGQRQIGLRLRQRE